MGDRPLDQCRRGRAILFHDPRLTGPDRRAGADGKTKVSRMSAVYILRLY